MYVYMYKYIYICLCVYIYACADTLVYHISDNESFLHRYNLYLSHLQILFALYLGRHFSAFLLNCIKLQIPLLTIILPTTTASASV